MNTLDTARRAAPALGLALFAALGLTAAAPAQAQNLVANPGFETGDFSGWTVARAGSGSLLGVSGGGGRYASSGNYGAYFGATGAQNDSITQFLPTVAGDDYAVSFSLANLGSPSDGFEASFGGAPLLSFTDSAAFPYDRYTFTVAAAAPLTALTFAGRQGPSYFALDDVTVTDLGAAPAAPVPEASTTVSIGLLLALGLGGLVVTAKRRKADTEAALPL